MRPQIMSETPIGMVEIKKELELIKTRDGELNFRANKTEEYLQHFIELGPKKFEELKTKLEELNIARIKPVHIIKIADVMPETVNELKVIMQAYPVTIKSEDLKKIVDVVKGYTKTKDGAKTEA